MRKDNQRRSGTAALTRSSQISGFAQRIRVVYVAPLPWGPFCAHFARDTREGSLCPDDKCRRLFHPVRILCVHGSISCRAKSKSLSSPVASRFALIPRLSQITKRTACRQVSSWCFVQVSISQEKGNAGSGFRFEIRPAPLERLQDFDAFACKLAFYRRHRSFLPHCTTHGVNHFAEHPL